MPAETKCTNWLLAATCAVLLCKPALGQDAPAAAPTGSGAVLDAPLPLGQAPADKPAQDKPVQDKPAQDKPAADNAMADKPSTAPAADAAAAPTDQPPAEVVKPELRVMPERDFAESEDAYARPSPYPISWELNFKHSDPKRIVVKVPGDLTPTAYWYMTYNVTNHTDQAANFDPVRDKERLFFPIFEMRAQDGRVVASNDGISKSVFDAIKQRANDAYLEDPLLMGGQILLGDDQARDSVAIWQEPLQRMGTFTIFATGMWGEAAPAKGSDGKPIADAKGNPIMLHKTLMMTYHDDGDETHPMSIRSIGEKFIMR